MLSDDERSIEFASGSVRVTHNMELREIPDEQSAKMQFYDQSRAMWELVARHQDLAEKVLSRLVHGADRNSLQYVELLNDVGISTLRRAALLYKGERSGCAFRTYARRALVLSYRKALKKGGARATHDRVDEAMECARPDHTGLTDHRVLLDSIAESAGLSRSEIDLLLSRFDSEESLRDIAKQIGVSSPQTVINMLNRLVQRCRETGHSLR